ncbi:hypothetical protein UPYG_G00145690 [Umbra pygmaea]|uniref:PILR alpha-associated neural protein n=1 Tax=Umbra pygmaea TaxID=75934 RepID=A0ABD0X0S0_UMBPY
MDKWFIAAVTRPTALRCLFFLLVTRPSTCNRDDGGGEVQADSHSAQLSVTGQVTPTPIWSVVWGPTLPLEDETHHILSSQETDLRHHSNQVPTPTAEAWPYQSAPGSSEPQEPRDMLEAHDAKGVIDGAGKAEEREPDEVDPQFYVTVTISSLLILTAVIITAKLCYDRSCSQQPPPLSRGVGPPLSLALPRTLAQEDSRQTLHSTPSFTDRERIPVVNF